MVCNYPLKEAINPTKLMGC